MTSLRNITPSLLFSTQQSGYKRPSFEYLLLTKFLTSRKLQINTLRPLL